eukprot:4364054-Alexandrium_andersonii.AAC.1
MVNEGSQRASLKKSAPDNGIKGLNDVDEKDGTRLANASVMREGQPGDKRSDVSASACHSAALSA